MGATTVEWWFYEGLVIFAGWLPSARVAVAVMGIAFNTTALTYTTSQGVAGAPMPTLSASYRDDVGAGRLCTNRANAAYSNSCQLTSKGSATSKINCYIA